MSAINQLTSQDTLSAGDRFAIYSADNGWGRKLKRWAQGLSTKPAPLE